MMYYTIDNPTIKPEQQMDIPYGSRVYVAIRPEQFPNLFLKVLDLDDGNWSSSDVPVVWPNDGDGAGLRFPVMDGSGMWTYYTFYYENDLILAKLYLSSGDVAPFSRVVNAKVYGFTRTIDGVTTKTASRVSFTGTDGNTYIFDYTLLLNSNWGNSNWTSHNVYLGILRDSEGVILGNATYLPSRVMAFKVGRRVVQTQSYTPYPGTIMAGNNTDKIPTLFAFYSVSSSFGGSLKLPDGEATNLVDGGSVEISDCPNITYTLANPITVPIKINCQEKSYCLIQF